MTKVLSENYLLLDFGNARKLEQFGQVILDRPCPAADGIKTESKNLWRDADLTLPQSSALPRLTQPWRVSFPLSENDFTVSLHFQLKLTPFGHVGVFPEQLNQWRWLFSVASEQNLFGSTVHASFRKKPQALNLFAYTGGSTLALALAGAEVVHVDASAPTVAWARSNAQLNKLENHPIRWIVEDARKFLQREIRRGNNYDIIVLDPPSYGHGPSGKAWDLASEWEEILNGCVQLLKNSPQACLLWTGHSDTPTQHEICDNILRNRGWQCDSGRSFLTDSHGRSLDAGYFVRALAPARAST